ncbi:hypothetical protein RUND412_007418 [Rhizina undulata]
MSHLRILYWHRTDLRLHDSPTLHEALSLSPAIFYPVWCWDPHYVYRSRVGPNRWKLLLDCQRDLSASLTRINPKQKLLVIREAPTTLLPKLVKEWKIDVVCWEKDPDAYAVGRDRTVRGLLEALGVRVIEGAGRTLWDLGELVERNGGPTLNITALTKAGEKIGHVPKPLAPPTSLPDPGNTAISFLPTPPAEVEDINANSRVSLDNSYSHGLAGPNNDYAPPTFSELSLKPATTPHAGGESVALEILATHAANREFTATFEKPLTAPTDFDPVGTTLLSPHLHFGSLSVREFYWRVQETITAWDASKIKNKKPASKPPTSLVGQLLFREMYFAAYLSIGPVFGTARDNPYCRYFDWHLSTSPHSAPRESLSDPTTTPDKAEEWLEKWKYGATGFPFIDACMRQLRLTGWIHHLARHATACFLTRGGCWISWERGAEVFDELLLDSEPAMNIGNWMWLSCSQFYSQYFRIYSPIAFGKKTDPEGKFIKRFCPELEGFEKKWIYEPWKAPIEVQKKAGCVVGKDYPWPMFVEVGEKGEKEMGGWEERRRICLEGMRRGFRIGLMGGGENVEEEFERRWNAGTEEGKMKEVKAVKKVEIGKKAGGSKRAEKGQSTLDGLVKRVKK